MIRAYEAAYQRFSGRVGILDCAFSVISTGFLVSLLNYLPADGVMIGVSATSKKQLLEHVSAHAGSLTEVPARAIFYALTQRERRGSTAIGGGMAIPHAVFAGLMQSVVITTTLMGAVAFDAHGKKRSILTVQFLVLIRLIAII